MWNQIQLQPWWTTCVPLATKAGQVPPKDNNSWTTTLIEMAGLQTTSTPIGAELNKPRSHWAASNGQSGVLFRKLRRRVFHILMQAACFTARRVRRKTAVHTHQVDVHHLTLFLNLETFSGGMSLRTFSQNVFMFLFYATLYFCSVEFKREIITT